jgi:hypothetical protein
MQAVSTLFKVHLHATPLHRPLQPRKVVSFSSDSPRWRDRVLNMDFTTEDRYKENMLLLFLFS